ncbi:hypothetical protein TNIN_308241 [Trichonephila inaurata madagascariensis]|uniref:Uncharacterized protein n=1 Tax=Trichonephila inaurata madagascariensis TaxID=2747483 RepID=A0A8X7BPZ2_9ARAC|nr:hypothetical protein TNIN_308241 [Trichonephila inaurata madagascariensis]
MNCLWSQSSKITIVHGYNHPFLNNDTPRLYLNRKDSITCTGDQNTAKLTKDGKSDLINEKFDFNEVVKWTIMDIFPVQFNAVQDVLR